MRRMPSLESVEGRLAGALRQLAALPGIGERFTGLPLDRVELESTVRDMLDRGSAWWAAVPALQDVQDWIEVHWATERRVRPPSGTVAASDHISHQSQIQLDPPASTCKLLLAAAKHGVETVAKHAEEFAAHGMIEVRSHYLLKGFAATAAKPLDDHCTLLPYREAFQQMQADPRERQVLLKDLGWPPANAHNVCVLEARSFERKVPAEEKFERYSSRLLQCGPEMLTLVLGLVWGKGFRLFGRRDFVADPVSATLPFFHTASSIGASISQILLMQRGFEPPTTDRPLNRTELAGLIGMYAALPDQTQRLFRLALRRLRDSTERMEFEDKVIDVCITLEALFMEDGEDWKQKTRVSRRGSWYFADSNREREETRTLIQEFYDSRSKIVHGKAPDQLTLEEEDLRREQFAGIENVARTSLKAMISEGRPGDWEESKVAKSIRQNPRRADKDILSVKSDSLSWSLQARKEIDKALESVWKPTIDNAPERPSDTSPVNIYQTLNQAQILAYRQRGIYYVVIAPALLYMAHPQWLNRAKEPLDEHTRYYCERDVDRHLQRWRKAADNKRVNQFLLRLENADRYLPTEFDRWRKRLQMAD